MHGPYPGELRTRVIDFVEEGASRREAAEQFDVSVSSAIRWVQRFRQDGTCEPMPRGGSTSPLEKHSRNSPPVFAVPDPLAEIAVCGILDPGKSDRVRIADPVEYVGKFGVFGGAVCVDNSPERCGLGRRRFRVERRDIQL